MRYFVVMVICAAVVSVTATIRGPDPILDHSMTIPTTIDFISLSIALVTFGIFIGSRK